MHYGRSASGERRTKWSQLGALYTNTLQTIFSLLLLIINEKKEDYGHISKKNVRLKCQDSGYDFSD